MKRINHEYYVSFEVAKLLKEAGFDWECCYCYDAETKDFLNDNEGEFNFNEGDDNDFYSAPTLDVVQRWLREEKQLEVRVNYHCVPLHFQVPHPKQWWHWEILNMKSTVTISGELLCFKNEKEYPQTYEEAQEEGIKKALEIILGKEV